MRVEQLEKLFRESTEVIGSLIEAVRVVRAEYESLLLDIPKRQPGREVGQQRKAEAGK